MSQRQMIIFLTVLSAVVVLLRMGLAPKISGSDGFLIAGSVVAASAVMSVKPRFVKRK